MSADRDYAAELADLAGLNNGDSVTRVDILRDEVGRVHCHATLNGKEVRNGVVLPFPEASDDDLFDLAASPLAKWLRVSGEAA